MDALLVEIKAKQKRRARLKNKSQIKSGRK